VSLGFRVWAPAARTVELELDGTYRVVMRAAANGWHGVETDFARTDPDYGFLLDGEGPFPDPRSGWQPHGVHGPSRVVDHATFPWNDGAWPGVDPSRGVFYELHIGTFTPGGTFDSAIERLDHIVSLGATVVEVMPIAEFPGHHGWGYDGVSLYAPHDAYGGPAAFKRFVDACHSRGLGVVVDVVYNHLGPDGNYLPRFGPYFTDRYTTPWGKAVNFDGPDSDDVRQFFLDNAAMWLRDYHCDGLRLDATHAIVDTSAQHFLEDLASQVRSLEGQLRRCLFLVAESDRNDPRLTQPQDAGGYGLDAQWSDDFHHALHAVLTGERGGYYADFGQLADVAAALTRVYVYDGRYSAFRRRRHGRPALGMRGDRFLGYLQNHDQVGNRARGDRSSALMSFGRLQVGAALVLTAPFVPMVFQGEEWGATTPFLYFTDHLDPALGEAVRSGRHQEFAAFGWSPDEVPDPQDEKTFVNSQLRWDELDAERHAQLLDWHRQLIALRRSEPDIHDGAMAGAVRFDETGGWIVVVRGSFRVAANIGGQPASLSVEAGASAVLCSAPGISVADGHILLPPDSAAVLRVT
jgi:maltooligosyltrehalose trehalohydrolase